MMLLIITTPVLAIVIKQHSILIHMTGRHDQRLRQATLDLPTLSSRNIQSLHISNVHGRVASVKDSDIELVVIFGGVRFLILDDMHGAPSTFPVGLNTSVEDGLRIGFLPPCFGVEDAREVWWNTAAAAVDVYSIGVDFEIAVLGVRFGYKTLESLAPVVGVGITGFGVHA